MEHMFDLASLQKWKNVSCLRKASEERNPLTTFLSLLLKLPASADMEIGNNRKHLHSSVVVGNVNKDIGRPEGLSATNKF